jgi:hypothetical protein
MKACSAHRPNDRRARLIVATGWIQTEMGAAAPYTIEACIPMAADRLQKKHGERVCASSTASKRRSLGDFRNA